MATRARNAFEGHSHNARAPGTSSSAVVSGRGARRPNSNARRAEIRALGRRPPPLPRTRRRRRGPPRAIIARANSVARPSFKLTGRRKMHARRRPRAWLALRHRHAANEAARGGGTAAVAATARRRRRQAVPRLGPTELVSVY